MTTLSTFQPTELEQRIHRMLVAALAGYPGFYSGRIVFGEQRIERPQDWYVAIWVRPGISEGTAFVSVDDTELESGRFTMTHQTPERGTVEIRIYGHQALDKMRRLRAGLNFPEVELYSFRYGIALSVSSDPMVGGVQIIDLGSDRWVQSEIVYGLQRDDTTEVDVIETVEITKTLT